MFREGVFLFLSALAIASCETVHSHDQNVICYVATWATYRPNAGRFTLEDVDPSLCTHLIYSFVGIDNKTFEIVSLDPVMDVENKGFERAVNLRRHNPKLKVSVAVGGWTEGSEKYSRMAQTKHARKAFIDSAVAFLRKYKFDGFDLDWEYPANRGGKPEDKQNFIILIKELKEAFDDDWLLTAAVSAGKSTIESAYDIPRLAEYLDFVHLMSYDYHGKWDGQTGHNAPLYPRADESPFHKTLNVNYSTRHYLSHGIPPNKLILGLGFYGRTFLLVNSSNPGIGAASRKSSFAGPYTKEDGFLGYNEICEKLVTERTWSIAWQQAHQAPYMFSQNMWVSYDDVNSLSIKVAFAQRLGLAGVMIWSMDTDDFTGKCGQPFPLLNSVNKQLALHATNRHKEVVKPVVVVPTETDDQLDKDKPTKTVIDLDVDNDLSKSEYASVSGDRENGGTIISASVALLCLALAALLAK